MTRTADFNGFVAMGYFAGKAVDQDGTHYNLETDIRIMKGHYIDEDGVVRSGLFGMI